MGGQYAMVTNEMEAGTRDQGGQALEEFERAKLIDGQQESPAYFEDFTLVGVRS